MKSTTSATIQLLQLLLWAKCYTRHQYSICLIFAICKCKRTWHQFHSSHSLMYFLLRYWNELAWYRRIQIYRDKMTVRNKPANHCNLKGLLSNIAKLVSLVGFAIGAGLASGSSHAPNFMFSCTSWLSIFKVTVYLYYKSVRTKISEFRTQKVLREILNLARGNGFTTAN